MAKFINTLDYEEIARNVVRILEKEGGVGGKLDGGPRIPEGAAAHPEWGWSQDQCADRPFPDGAVVRPAVMSATWPEGFGPAAAPAAGPAAVRGMRPEAGAHPAPEPPSEERPHPEGRPLGRWAHRRFCGAARDPHPEPGPHPAPDGFGPYPGSGPLHGPGMRPELGPLPGPGLHPDPAVPGPRPEPGAPRPWHEGRPPVEPLRAERRRRQRVALDAEALQTALEARGLASAARSLEAAPAEVKVIAALLLDVPVNFAGDARPRRERMGFENPLLVGERFSALAQRLDVEPPRLRAELEGAPDEMLAVIMLLADGPQSGPAHPVAAPASDPAPAAPADSATPASDPAAAKPLAPADPAAPADGPALAAGAPAAPAEPDVKEG